MLDRDGLACRDRAALDPVTYVTGDPPTLRLIHDLDAPCSTRLLAITTSLPPPLAEKIALAAQHAGEVLTRMRRVLLTPDPAAWAIAGRFSDLVHGRVLVLVADGEVAVCGEVAVDEMDDLAARKMRKFAAQVDYRPPATPNLTAAIADLALSVYGYDRSKLPAAVLGPLLRVPEQRDVLRRMAEDDVVPALVVLLDDARRMAVTVPVVHGRAFPGAELERVWKLKGELWPCAR